MIFIPSPIPDLLVATPKIFEDPRGYFFESFNQKAFEDIGIKTQFVQDNQSYSHYGTIRGLHLQKGSFAQAKLVRVIKGEVLDVAVDLRKDSKTYGQHFSIILNDKNMKQLYIPRGFAHGFSVLSESAIFSYKCDNFYNQSSESGIIYNDSTLSIDWKIPKDKIKVSEKDLKLGSMNDFNTWI